VYPYPVIEMLCGATRCLAALGLVNDPDYQGDDQGYDQHPEQHAKEATAHHAASTQDRDEQQDEDRSATTPSRTFKPSLIAYAPPCCSCGLNLPPEGDLGMTKMARSRRQFCSSTAPHACRLPMATLPGRVDDFEVKHHPRLVLEDVAVEHVELLTFEAVGEIHGALHGLPRPK
jgi:hypothetical protein